MAGFQIHNAQGEALSMGTLDKEACAFWGVELQDKYYASPDKEGRGINWFDMIGRAITDPDNYRTGYTNYMEPYTNMSWVEVAIRMTLCNIAGTLVNGTKSEDSNQYTMSIRSETAVINNILGARDFALPFLNLIKHWEEKGYTPHRVE